jgi:hypothetical protein
MEKFGSGIQDKHPGSAKLVITMANIVWVQLDAIPLCVCRGAVSGGGEPVHLQDGGDGVPAAQGPHRESCRGSSQAVLR